MASEGNGPRKARFDLRKALFILPNLFTLSSIFQVLDPKSFTANLSAEGTGIEPASWRNVGAEGVVKGLSAMRGATTRAETTHCSAKACGAVIAASAPS